MKHTALAMALCLGFALDASADSGVIEINQARALAGGITPADAPGFPITLDQPGSYVLTGNLSVASNAVSAISITNSHVTLDLGDFEIAGPGTCSGTSNFLTCTLASGQTGITTSGTRPKIRNGTIRGFGGYGVDLGAGRAERVHVAENVAGGIFTTSSGAQVIDSIAERNRGDGIHTLIGVVRNCSVTGNYAAGITGFGNLIEGNSVRANGTQGINAAERALVRGNSVSGNNADGIVVLAGSLVQDNTTDFNGQAGIAALSTANIRGNVSQGNTGVGIYMVPEAGGVTSAFSYNVVVGNGSTTSSGINMGGNSCNGTATCP
jgi:hypothetical protein